MLGMAEDMRDGQKADAGWFREPSRREHYIGGWVFLGFGIFFALSFGVLSGWWLRWVMLALGVCSVVRSLYHLVRARMAHDQVESGK